MIIYILYVNYYSVLTQVYLLEERSLQGENFHWGCYKLNLGFQEMVESQDHVAMSSNGLPYKNILK